MNKMSIEEAERRIREIANSLDEQDRDSFALKAILFSVLGSIIALGTFSNQIHELHMLCWKFACEKTNEIRNKENYFNDKILQ